MGGQAEVQELSQRLGAEATTVRSVRVTQQDLGFGARGFHRDCMVYGLVWTLVTALLYGLGQTICKAV